MTFPHAKYLATAVRTGLVAALAVSAAVAVADPITPYTPVFPGIAPIAGPGVPMGPAVTPGKEFSNELDRDSAGAADPEQVIVWDGIGGVLDGVDFGEIPEVDAIAHSADALYTAVTTNTTAVLFSTRVGPPPVAGPGVDAGAPMLDCAFGDPVCFETTAGAGGTWATPAEVDLDHPPVNLDGLEVWGPEAASDTDRFSLFGDPFIGVSIFQYDPGTGVSTPWLLHAALVAKLVGLAPVFAEFSHVIDLDALMVLDVTPGDGLFDPEGGDSILFSLWALPVIPGDAAYVWDSTGLALLDHGGHLWTPGWLDGLEVDGLEAGAVPLPAALPLLAAGLVGLVTLARRRGGSDVTC